MKFLNDEMREKFERGFANQNGDGYGERCFTYAVDWADQMEKYMAEGETLEECADNCASIADTDGITGFMYGTAVAILADCWEHGETLRRWHNKDYGIEDDRPGVVNPAILNVTVPDENDAEDTDGN